MEIRVLKHATGVRRIQRALPGGAVLRKCHSIHDRETYGAYLLKTEGDAPLGIPSLSALTRLGRKMRVLRSWETIADAPSKAKVEIIDGRAPKRRRGRRHK